jgi:hypothetical protein
MSGVMRIGRRGLGGVLSRGGGVILVGEEEGGGGEGEGEGEPVVRGILLLLSLLWRW